MHANQHTATLTHTHTHAKTPTGVLAFSLQAVGLDRVSLLKHINPLHSLLAGRAGGSNNKQPDPVCIATLLNTCGTKPGLQACNM